MGVIKERRDELEDSRIKYAVNRLTEIGITGMEYDKNSRCLIISAMGSKIRLWPYTGYFNGKGIRAGRGVENLIKKLKKSN